MRRLGWLLVAFFGAGCLPEFKPRDALLETLTITVEHIDGRRQFLATMPCFPLEGSVAKLGEQELEVDNGHFIPLHAIGCLDTTLKLPEGEEPHDASTVLTIEDEYRKIVVDMPTLWGDRYWAFEAGPEVGQGELVPKPALAGFEGDVWPETTSEIAIDSPVGQCSEPSLIPIYANGDQLQFPYIENMPLGGCGAGNARVPALPFGVHVLHKGRVLPHVARCEGVGSCSVSIAVRTDVPLNIVR